MVETIPFTITTAILALLLVLFFFSNSLLNRLSPAWPPGSPIIPPLHARQSHGVAILLSGEPRTVSVTLPGLLRDIVFPLHAEVFFFCSGSNLRACKLLELSLRSSLGEQLRAFDSLESLLERQSQGIIKYPYDSMAVSYLNLHEAWRVRLGKSIKLYQGMQFVMLRFAWDLAREQERVRGAHYYALMRLRPDILLLDPLPLVKLNLKPGGWVYAINDWLIFGRRDAMQSVVLLADSYGTLQLLPGMEPSVISSIIKDNVPLCGEAQLMLRLLNDSIRFYPFPSVTAGLVRPDADPRNALLPTWSESEAASFLKSGKRPNGAQFSHEFLIRGWLGPSGTFMYLYEEAPLTLEEDTQGPGIFYLPS